jgi:eukaryotic-like serine/threonine-protein kinase
MKTSHCLDPQTLEQLLSQTLSSKEHAQCESHLEHCEECRMRLEKVAGDPQWWQSAAEMLSGDLQETTSAFKPSNSDDDLAEDNRHAQAVSLKHVRQVLQSPSHPEMLGRLDSYDIESFVGQGGFGVVFKAYDSNLNRPVAIKVLAPHLATSGVARRRFTREAQAAAAVVHPNVVPIHAVQSEAEFPYLVMTYVPGSSLQTFVQQRGPLEPKAVIRIAQQVAAGLAAAHRQGLVHRDIKPGNILLENELSRALITDFGLARAADDAAISQTGWLAGTPHYMSPEQSCGADLDGRSDLFSLGSVMYFMATGREPFRGSQPLSILKKIASDQPISANRINSDVPKTLSKIIDRLLEKRPEDRIQSAQQVSDLLESLLGHLQQPQSMARPKIPNSARQVREFLWKSATVACAAILLVGVSFLVTYYLNRGDETQIERRPPTVADVFALQAEMQRDEQQAIAVQQGINALSRRLEATANSWSHPATEAEIFWRDSSNDELSKIEREVRELERQFNK